MSKSILFVKIGAIGDVVMAMPAVNHLLQAGNQVTWVVGKTSADLVRAFVPQVKVVVVNDSKLLKGNLFEKLNEIANLQVKLFFQKFECVILAHADRRYQVLTALKSKDPVRFSFDRDWHHADAYFELARIVTRDQHSKPEDFRAKPLTPWRGETSRKVALAPGGAKNVLADDDLRRWPLENYAEVAKDLIRRGFEVHIFGAPSDEWVLEGFKGIPVISEIGKHDLVGLVKEWSDYRFLLTHDSGPLHLAGLAQIPVYATFGPTLPQWRFPVGNSGQGIVLDIQLECQPCYDGKNYAVCSHKNCLRFLKPDLVLSKISDSHLRI